MKRYILSIIFLIIITIASVMRVSAFPQVDIPNVDKPIHFFMYALLTFCLLFDHSHHFSRSFSRWSYLVLPLVSIGYGGIMELVQALLPYRSCSIYDFIANTIGALIGTVVFILLSVVTCSKTKNSSTK